MLVPANTRRTNKGFDILFKAKEKVHEPNFHPVIERDGSCCGICEQFSLLAVLGNVIKGVNFLSDCDFNLHHFKAILEEIVTAY